MQKILSWKIVQTMKKILLLARDKVELMADKVQPNGFKLWLIAWIPRMLYLRLTANELLVDPVNEMAAIGYPASLAGYNWNDVQSPFCPSHNTVPYVHNLSLYSLLLS